MPYGSMNFNLNALTAYNITTWNINTTIKTCHRNGN